MYIIMQQTCRELDQWQKQKVVGFVDQHLGQFGAAEAAGLLQQAQDAGDPSKSERETGRLETLAEAEQCWWNLTQMAPETL